MADTFSDLVYFVPKFKRHLHSVHKLSRNQEFADAYHNFEVSAVASPERDQAFQILKSMLKSKVNSSIDSHTTVLDKGGKVAVDDVEYHDAPSCGSCHNSRHDVDVMISKLKSAGVVIKQSRPTIDIQSIRPASRQETRNIKSMEKTIHRYITYGWIVSIERNLYSKLYDDMPTVGHPTLPDGHPTLPVETYICFTRAIDTNKVILKGEITFVKTYIKLPKGLIVTVNYL